VIVGVEDGSNSLDESGGGYYDRALVHLSAGKLDWFVGELTSEMLPHRST
jgi:hypothetical protein